MQPKNAQRVIKLEIRTGFCISMLLRRVGARAFGRAIKFLCCWYIILKIAQGDMCMVGNKDEINKEQK